MQSKSSETNLPQVGDLLEGDMDEGAWLLLNIEFGKFGKVRVPDHHLDDVRNSPMLEWTTERIDSPDYVFVFLWNLKDRTVDSWTLDVDLFHHYFVQYPNG